MRLLLVLAAFLTPLFCSAQYPEQDKLLWNGKVYRFFSSVVTSRSDFQELNNKINTQKKKDGVWLYCWWSNLELVNDELYLNDIFYCKQDSGIKADLKNVFDAQYQQGRVKTSWFSDSLVLDDGKDLNIWSQLKNRFLYERNIILTFKNGKLVKKRIGDNSKSYQSPYFDKEEILKDFIYSNINWEVIPVIERENNIIIVSCTSGSERKPERIEIIRKAGPEILNEEVWRVMKLLPDWNVYYYAGYPISQGWNIPVNFNEGLRERYTKK